MIDLGISKMALIGVVALIVIGPEKLPRVARTVGTLMGKAQRYVSDVKAEVSRSMELDELKKMKESVTEAAKDFLAEVGFDPTLGVTGQWRSSQSKGFFQGFPFDSVSRSWDLGTNVRGSLGTGTRPCCRAMSAPR